jgi:hypothetical protein
VAAKKRMSQAVTLGAVVPLAVAFSGCADDEADETAYCVNQQEEVVENRYCDDDSGFGGGFLWFFYAGGGGFNRGDSVRGYGGDRVSTANRSELARRGVLGSTARSGGVGRSTAS